MFFLNVIYSEHPGFRIIHNEKEFLHPMFTVLWDAIHLFQCMKLPSISYLQNIP